MRRIKFEEVLAALCETTYLATRGYEDGSFVRSAGDHNAADIVGKMLGRKSLLELTFLVFPVLECF